MIEDGFVATVGQSGEIDVALALALVCGLA